jgi:hypothetical protein
MALASQQAKNSQGASTEGGTIKKKHLVNVIAVFGCFFCVFLNNQV